MNRTRDGRIKTATLAALAALALAGCAGEIHGPPEQIKVATHPGKADCALSRLGKVIGRIGGTPGFITVPKSRYDITIRCDKAGYKPAVYRLRGGATGIFFGDRGHGQAGEEPVNAFDVSYDVVVSLDLVPTGAVAPAPAQKPQWACPITPSQKPDLTGCVLLK